MVIQMNQRILPNATRQLSKLAAHKFVRLSASILLVPITILITVAVAKTSDDPPDPGQLIQTMSESLQYSSYEGTIVTLSGTVLDTLTIKHVNDGTDIREQLISLNGEAREIFRNNSLITCIWPKCQSVITMKARERKPVAGYDFTLNNSYQYKLLPNDRIAGRSTYVVAIIANDQERFSYRVWIDKETNMLLKSISFDENNMPVEQMMFTDIRFGGDIREAGTF